VEVDTPGVTTRLFDHERTKRRRGQTKALVAIDPGVCPACSTELVETALHEPALIRHGGYGATRRTVDVYCPRDDCRWSMQREVSEVRP
jgi:hypothetical protein